MECDSTREILSLTGSYTRINLDPNPPEVIEDPKRILRRSLSLPVEGIKIIDDVIFDKKFEQALSRSKSSLDLS